MSVPDESLLSKVAKSLSLPSADAPTGTGGSILVAAAQSYGARPIEDDLTLPTGFDPHAAALFEAVVEAAFLVGNADGHFDDDERRLFQSVVLQAVNDGVDKRQIEALMGDLDELLREDGIDARVGMVGRTVTKPVQQREVLRIAALLANVSGGVSAEEREVLSKLATAFGLGEDAVTDALGEAERALTT
jgi:tellurite resistance protein